MRKVGGPEGGGDALDPLGHGPASLTEDDPSLVARAYDHPWVGELEGHVRRAGNHGSGADHRRNRLRIVEPVLHGEHHRVPRHQRRERARSDLRVVGLDREKDEIDGFHSAGIGDGSDEDGRLPRRRAYRQAASLHRLQVRSPGDEDDVVPGPREKGPVVPPDSPRPEHCDPHGAELLLPYETLIVAIEIPVCMCIHLTNVCACNTLARQDGGRRASGVNRRGLDGWASGIADRYLPVSATPSAWPPGR